MSSGIETACFGTLLALAVVWNLLVFWLFRRLRLRHPATYEAIGSPSLFWNNSVRNNWLFLKFLFQSQWKSLGDTQLSAVARTMQVLSVVFTVGFVVLLIAFVTIGIKSAR